MSLQDTYQKGMDFAAKAHGEQKVPDKGYSYVVHIAEVAMEIMSIANESRPFNVEISVQCALLHDVLEDTNVSYEELEKAFGTRVAQGVQALTKDHSLEKTHQMEDSLERILKQPKEIWMVKMADRITNLQKPPGYWTNEKILNYKVEAQMIYERLKEGNDKLAERLAEKINNYDKYLV